MLCNATGGIDRARYMAVCSTAIEDLSLALEAVVEGQGSPSFPAPSPHEMHRPFVHVDPDMPQILFGALRTKRLIHAICQKSGFSVSFLPSGPIAEVLPPTYLSWLFVDFGAGALTILYHAGRLIQMPGSVFQKDIVLAKLLLHECGHARLHLELIRAGMASGNLAPSLDAEHEEEAWVYALLIWGALTGDVSSWSRENAIPDRGYLLA